MREHGPNYVPRRGDVTCEVCGYLYRRSRSNALLQVCPRCDPLKSREKMRIYQHNNKAKRIRNEVGDLTLEQWLVTLDHFEWKCAYCREEPYEALEHFYPGGSTTQSNCVPACINCNNAKGPHTFRFFLYRNLSQETIDRVEEFLNRF